MARKIIIQISFSNRESLKDAFMARTIYLKKEEKLAMLRIMIDISNHYNERLPHASQIIRRRSETLLELSNGVEEANNMPLTEALEIVNCFKHNQDKIDFIKELLAEMLQYSHYGALHKYENSDYDDDYELIDEFRAEWNYIYQLLKEIILVGDAKDLFTIELISWRNVYMHFEDWIVVDMCDNIITNNKNNEIIPTTSRQFSTKDRIKSKEQVQSSENLKQTSDKKIMKAINLGLSVMWGECNIGAKECYEDGNLYTWNEIMPETDGYNAIFSPTAIPSSMTCDLAEKMYGSGWQIPTKEHIIELMQNCKFEVVTLYENKFLLRAIGPNGNSIYLPTTGYRDWTGNKVQNGFYWTSTKAVEKNNTAYSLQVSSQMIWGYNHINAYQSVRPVYRSNNNSKKNYNKIDNPIHYTKVTFDNLKDKIEGLCKKLQIRFNWSELQSTNSSFRKFPVATSKQVIQLEQGNILGHGNITFIYSSHKLVALLIEKASKEYIDSVKNCGMVYGILYASITFGENQRPDLINKLDSDDILVWLF